MQPSDAIFDNRPSRGAGIAVRPQDAAALIVLRRDGAQPRLLMGRRSAGHDFMPGKWVFPGGRLDRADYRAPCHGGLKPETEGRLRHGLTASRARALALAAIRETFEETGLLLGAKGVTHPHAGPWRDFLARGVLPDLAALDMVARAVTPPGRPKQFDARFLLAPAEALVSLEPRSSGELDEIAWVGIDEALRLELPGVTRFVVREVAARLADPARPALYLRFVGLQTRVSLI